MLGCFFTDILLVLHCQSVCKTWRMLLPGRDPVLLEKLFLKASFAKEAIPKYIDEQCIDEQSIDEDEGGAVVGYQGEAGPATNAEAVVPCIVVLLRAPLTHVVRMNELPRLAYSIEVMDGELEGYENLDRLVGFREDSDFHPIIENPARFMDVINPYFVSPYEDNASLQFADLQQLIEKTSLPEDYDYEDGGWKNALICRPALGKITISMRWPFLDARRVYTVEKEEGEGVTVGDFVGCFREMLSHAKEDLMSFSEQLVLCCSECNYHSYDGNELGWVN